MKRIIFSLMIVASTAGSAKILTVDNSVVTGQLDNGIRYFIKHNAAPRGQVSFHLVHNIGSLAETPEEYGLAHFLEHIAFQGTRRFPGRGIVNMLERHGVMFSHDVNAVTSQNHTIYQLSGIPNDDANVLDSCMMVMADWAYDLTLDDKKIDNERGVIIEEIKMRNTPDFEAQTQWANTMLQGSGYATHDIIGTPQQIATFKPETLRAFYRRWHRPDLEAVVVVGDIDVKEMEVRLRRIMSEVPKAEGPCPLSDRYQLCSVPAHDTLRFCGIHREGIDHRSVIVINRVDDTPDTLMSTTGYLRQQIIVELFNILAAKRASQMAKSDGSPFLGVNISVIPLKRGYFTYQLGASLNSDDEARGLRMLMLEGERLRQVGLTTEEFEYGRKVLSQQIERSYRYSTIDNETVCQNIESHWLDGKPLLSAHQDYQLSLEALNNITLQQVNEEIKTWCTGRNRTVVVIGPPSEYAIEAADAADIIAGAAAMDYSLYTYKMPEETPKKPFVSVEPEGGKIIGSRKIDGNMTEWTLSNGAKVIYRPVFEDKSSLCLRAVRPGGCSLFDIDMLPAAEKAGAWVLSSGAGDFNSMELDTQMSIHGIDIMPSVNLYSNQMVGRAMPDEAVSLFQIIYLLFTNPHLDSLALSSICQQVEMSAKPDPMSDTIRMMRTNYSPRTLLYNKDYYRRCTPERIIDVWKKCFGCPDLFTFIITGNLPEEEARRLCSTYLASLPVSRNKKHIDNKWRDVGIRPMKGCNSRKVTLQGDERLASVVVTFNYSGKGRLSDNISCKIISQVFQSRCMDELREKDGSVYAVTIHNSISQIPKSEYEITAEFSCTANDADKLTTKIYDLWNKMASDGITEAEYNRVVLFLSRRMKENSDKADVWADCITDMILSEKDILTPSNYPSTLKSMSLDDVNSFLRKMSAGANRLDVTFLFKQ